MKMGFCWGAFGLTWIWGCPNRVWIAVWLGLAFVGVACIPGMPPGGLLGLANLAFGLWLGEKGHELAWRNRRFQSLEAYRQTMQVWNKWGIAGCIIQCLLAILIVAVGVTGKQY